MSEGMKIICIKCNGIIQSMHRHDFVWCSCKSVAIDGGSSYTKISGNREDWEFYVEQIPQEDLHDNTY